MAQSLFSIKTSRFAVLASVCLIVAALYLAQEFLVPLALAALLSFLLAPLVRRLERFKFPRAAAVLTTVALAFVVLGVIGFVVYDQMADLSRELPQYESRIQEKVKSFRSGGFLAGLRHVMSKGQEILTSTTAPTATVATQVYPLAPTTAPVAVTPPSTITLTPLQLVTAVGGKILGPIGIALIVIVFTIFMLLQREDLRDRLIRLIGQGKLTITTQALDDAGARVSRYLLMQTLVNSSVGVAVTISLWTIGKVNGQPFPSPALWGLLAALLRFIPYIGIWVAAITPVLLSLAVYSTGRAALETLAAYACIEAVAANALEPFLYGSSTGIATIAVLIAAAFWTWLWGPVGLLLSTPLTVCLVVVGKYVPQLEFLSIMLGDEPALSPPARIYQRLLSLDPEEAVELVNEYAKKMTIEQMYDEILLPALAMAEQDRHLEKLEDDRHEVILRGLRDIIEEMRDQQHIEQGKNEAAQTAADTKADQIGKPNFEPVRPVASAFLPPPPGARPVLPKGSTVNVTILPAQDQADEIAGIMLGHLLEMRGYGALAVSVEKLASERVAIVEESKADLVCVSALPPAAVTHARYLCKRLHGKLPDIDLVVGLWTSTGDLQRSKQRIACVHEVQMANSLRQALEQIHQMAQSKLVGTLNGKDKF